MKKSRKTLEPTLPANISGKTPKDDEGPIIHNENMDLIEGVDDTFTSANESAKSDFTEQLDITSVHYKELKVSSPVFKDQESIPSKFTCEGKNISPPLEIENIPDEAKCLVLIVDDPDAPIAAWVHWIVWNIPITHRIKENAIHGTEGINDFEKHGYGGPCPPSGTHRYFFKVYVLDTLLDLNPNIRKPQLEKAMSGHIIGFGELVGIYKRLK